LWVDAGEHTRGTVKESKGPLGHMGREQLTRAAAVPERRSQVQRAVVGPRCLGCWDDGCPPLPALSTSSARETPQVYGISEAEMRSESHAVCRVSATRGRSRNAAIGPAAFEGSVLGRSHSQTKVLAEFPRTRWLVPSVSVSRPAQPAKQTLGISSWKIGRQGGYHDSTAPRGRGGILGNNIRHCWVEMMHHLFRIGMYFVGVFCDRVPQVRDDIRQEADLSTLGTCRYNTNTVPTLHLSLGCSLAVVQSHLHACARERGP
jgi:hypothetical protein